MRKRVSFCLVLLLIMLLCSCYSSQEATSTSTSTSESMSTTLDTTESLAISSDIVQKDITTSATEYNENELETTSNEEKQDFDAIATSLMEQLAYDMWEPYITLEPFKTPDYVENNAATRLAMRWPDYHLAEIDKYPDRQLISIDSIDTYIQEGQKPVDGLLTVRGMSEIRYTRINPSVNGVNVEFCLVIDVAEKDFKIIDIDMVFNSNFRNMKENIERHANGEKPSIQMIDSVVEEEIKNIL